MKQWILPALLLGPVSAWALDPELAISQYTERCWGIDDGLGPGTYNFDLSGDGFLWVATNAGVVEFDGLRSEVIVPGPAEFVKRDRSGTLWVQGRESRGQETLRRRTPDGRIDEAAIPAGGGGFVEDARGTLWAFGSFGFGRVEGMSVSIVRSLETWRAYAGPGGEIWLPAEGGIEAWKDGVLVERLGTSPALRGGGPVAEQPPGTLWTANGQGLAQVDKGAVRRFLTTKDGLASTQGAYLHGDEDGNLWIATYSGLTRLSPDGRISKPAESSPLRNSVLGAMREDSNGNLWITMRQKGVCVLRDPAIVPIGAAEGMERLASLATDRDGHAWVGTWRSLFRVEGFQLEAVPIPEEASHVIRSIAADPTGPLWFLTDSRLVRFDRKKTFDTLDVGSRSIQELALESGSVFVYGGYDPAPPLEVRGGKVVGSRSGDSAIVGVLPFGDRQWWVDVLGRPFVRNSAGALAAVSPSADLPPGWSEVGFADTRGNRWLGTSSGIHVLRTDRWEKLGPEQGFPEGAAYPIREPDSDRLVWAGTDDGFVRFDIDDALAALDGRTSRVSLEHFGAAHGLRERVFFGYPPAAGAGRFIAWMSSELAIVDPKRIRKNTRPPTVKLDRAVVDGTPFLPGAVLAPAAQRLEFQYTASGLEVAEALRFRYRLVGFDGDWVDARNRRTAFYTNVPPGKYEFRVIAANEDGVWNETGAAIRFELLPTFLQSWSFLVLCAVGLVGLGAGGYRARVWQLRARGRELEREVEDATRLLAARMDEKLVRTGQVARFGEFAASVAHNLKTPLTFLRGEIELLDEKRRSGNVPAAELESALRALLEQVRRMNAEIETGMSFVRPGSAPVVDVDLAALAREIALLLRSRATASNVKIDIAIDGELRARGNLDNLRHAIANLVSNAIDAMPGGGTVTISGRRAGSFVELRVADTGPGIPESVRAKLFRPFVSTKGEQGTGLGLASCRRIVEEEHGGKIRLEPSSSGAHFVIELPA